MIDSSKPVGTKCLVTIALREFLCFNDTMPHFGKGEHRKKVKHRTKRALPKTTKLIKKIKHSESSNSDSDTEDEIDVIEQFEEVFNSHCYPTILIHIITTLRLILQFFLISKIVESTRDAC